MNDEKFNNLAKQYGYNMETRLERFNSLDPISGQSISTLASVKVAKIKESTHKEEE